ncbi:GRF1-INTERACTING FACTOR 2 family protein [Striga asiatica]|uniref:GRF1-INTERACTING FACTOR 2 family protein n=1 Tax=Striga asiatica TaxID=4170 RepID=A0A5A7QMW3_STRAF|nr:GRF1-INTERACTING FACTOR 2 family protein [Striga asiatica]
MQQPGPMFPVMPSFPPTNITTEQIQKYLDENKKLILAILDNQNLGKLAECAQYQAQLQKNLMYLAAIADAQPQTPAMPTQMTPPHPAMQQPGGFYMPHHPQAAGPMQHPAGGLFPARGPPFTSPLSLCRLVHCYLVLTTTVVTVSSFLLWSSHLSSFVCVIVFNLAFWASEKFEFKYMKVQREISRKWAKRIRFPKEMSSGN